MGITRLQMVQKLRLTVLTGWTQQPVLTEVQEQATLPADNT